MDLPQGFDLRGKSVRTFSLAAAILLAGALQASAQEGPPLNLLATGQETAVATASAPSIEVETDDADSPEISADLKRQTVDYETAEPAGSVVVDTEHTHLYFILGAGKAVRYGIGVGREGFTWAGREKITKMAEWPDWHPPAEMIDRQPYLPRFVAGGVGNPLGARAMYLGKTVYRIHGTNQPGTIGKFVSSGCIRLTNEDVEDLYSRVKMGAPVVVLPKQLSGADPTTSAADTTIAGRVPLPKRRPKVRHAFAVKI